MTFSHLHGQNFEEKYRNSCEKDEWKSSVEKSGTIYL